MHTEPQQEDPEQQILSQIIEADTDNYPRFQDMKYFDDGDILGLLTCCTNANLIDNSSRRDKKILV